MKPPASVSRDDIGRLSPVLAIGAPFVIAANAALSMFGERLLMNAVGDPVMGAVLASSCAAGIGFLCLLGPLVVWRNLKRPSRSRGRARLAMLGVAASLHGLGWGGLVALLATSPDTVRMLESGLGIHPATDLEPYVAVALGVGGVGGLLTLVTVVTTWFLLPKSVRQRSWLVFDSLLLCAVAWAVIQLPVEPESPAGADLFLPVLRHTLLTLGLLRLGIRVIPLSLGAIESAGFRPLVAARHLRSKKSGFLTAIGLLSIFAVALSCMMLTTVLSVMGGFRSDLKRKILGNNAHIVVDRQDSDIEGYVPLVERIARVRQVTGAAAYVSGEVMLSSASNLATAVLRGVEPSSVGRVNDLPDNMTSGKLEYLEHPEKLLDLPEDPVRSPLLPLGPRDTDSGPMLEKPGPGLDADAPRTDGKAGANRGEDLDRQRAEMEAKIAELEAFLRDGKRASDADQATESDEPRSVLPGIIIGQELARALRLYVGDEVNVVAPLGALGPSGPMPKARPFRVAGIFYSGMYEYDMKFTYVSLSDAQRFLGRGDAISGIEVKVADVDQAPAAAVAIRSTLQDSDLRVRDWQTLNSQLFGALELEKLAMFVALGIAILVASFCIAGTLTLLVQEKGREVAILKAMGTSDRAVVGVFIIEGGLIGMLGAILGLFLGFMTCFGAEHFGVRMNPEVYYIDRLPVHVDLTEFAFTGLAAVVVCLIVTVYPALLASRLRPVEALRYE